MSRKRKGSSQKKLTDEEVKAAAPRMMAGAQAHQRASVYCLENPKAKPPNIDSVFFQSVSFELILNSIEQSLRLLLLIHYSSLRPKHNIYALYQKVLRESGGKDGIRNKIVNHVNFIRHSQGMGIIAEEDIRKCLKKHDSSYSSFRYFGLDDEARPTLKWEMKEYEVKLLHSFALALIAENVTEMKKRDIGIYQSMSLVPESEMTDDLRELMIRMKEPSTR